MSESRLLRTQIGTGRAPRVLEVSPAELGTSDMLAALLHDRLGAVLVRDALTDARDVVRHLLDHSGPAGPIAVPPFPGETWGHVLVLAQPHRQRYHACSTALQQIMHACSVNPLEVMQAQLERAAGQSVRCPDGATGPYVPATVRRLRPGQEVALHSEHDHWPSMSEVRSQADTSMQLSCYTTLQTCTEGGEIILYHRPPAGEAPAVEGRSTAEVHGLLSPFGFTELLPRTGDLIIFGGGRYNHRVRPVVHGERWTLGGFLAPARQGGGYLVWS
ncbi:MAG: hypothetical protein CL927_05780 [Deltaproteobacteria bacterium]|nr:hypothetical protein [Deltaproteobacteria bacterium]HCH64798.1 hypothetical protein [Deltaproteobacteria bacterium]